MYMRVYIYIYICLESVSNKNIDFIHLGLGLEILSGFRVNLKIEAWILNKSYVRDYTA